MTLRIFSVSFKIKLPTETFTFGPNRDIIKKVATAMGRDSPAGKYALPLWLTFRIVTKRAIAMIFFGNSNKYLLERKGNIFYFFQAEKKVAKKPPAGNPCGKYLGNAYNELM